MSRWLRWSVFGIEAMIVLAAVYVEPTYQVRGKLHGEAIFDGKPTSWWRAELEHWEIILIRDRCGPIIEFRRRPTWLEALRARWITGVERTEGDIAAARIVWGVHRDGVLVDESGRTAVLNALLEDRAPAVRRIAQAGLNLPPEDSRGTP
jgi:hypothetical protein